MLLYNYGKWTRLNIITSGISMKSPQWLHMPGHVDPTTADAYSCVYYTYLLHGNTVASYIKTMQYGWVQEPK